MSIQPGTAPRQQYLDFNPNVYFHHKSDHVFEGSPPPRLSFIVCSLPRSGSSLLCELLASSELAGAPSEFFDSNQMHAFCEAWGTETFDEYLEALMSKKTSPNGLFGVKAHYHQLVEAFGDAGAATAFPNLHLVYIKRLDHIGQAVSFARAIQTAQWTSEHEPAPAPPTYDREQIRSLHEWVDREEAAWERWFEDLGAPLFRVVYEEFTHAIEKTVIDVMHFLEIELPAGFEVPAPTLDRQADELNDEWVSRYLAEVAPG